MKLTLTLRVTMMQLTSLLDGRSVLDKLFFQNEAQKVLYKPALVSDLISFFGGVIASQNSGKLENQQNQINPSVPQLHNQSQIKSI